MYKTSLQIGNLRKKKFLKCVENIQKDFPHYHLIVEVESRRWFSTTYLIWVRESYHLSNVLNLLELSIF